MKHRARPAGTSVRQSVITVVLSLSLIAALYMTFLRTDNPASAPYPIPAPTDSSELSLAESVPRITSPSVRRIFDLPTESISTLKLDTLLSYPTEVIVHEGYIYVSDIQAYTIYKFDLNGHFVTNFASGHGQGPGEVGHISDFVLDSEHLWLVDSDRNLIYKYTLDGVLKDQFNDNRSKYRLVKTKNALISAGTDFNNFITSYSSDYGVMNEFGYYISYQGNPVTTQGRLTTDGTNVYYASLYASFVYKYSDSGTLMYIIETVDKLPYPSDTISNNTAGQAVMRAPRPDTLVADIETDDRFLYVNTLVKVDPWYNMIDVYDLESGEYNYSVRSPVHFHMMDIDNGRFYAVQDTTILTFILPDIGS